MKKISVITLSAILIALLEIIILSKIPIMGWTIKVTNYNTMEQSVYRYVDRTKTDQHTEISEYGADDNKTLKIYVDQSEKSPTYQIELPDKSIVNVVDQATIQMDGKRIDLGHFQANSESEYKDLIVKVVANVSLKSKMLYMAVFSIVNLLGLFLIFSSQEDIERRWRIFPMKEEMMFVTWISYKIIGMIMILLPIPMIFL